MVLKEYTLKSIEGEKTVKYCDDGCDQSRRGFHQHNVNQALDPLNLLCLCNQLGRKVSLLLYQPFCLRTSRGESEKNVWWWW